MHTHEVQNEITLLLANLEEAESAARGYVITGVESYLAPYSSSIAAAEEHRKHLTHLVIDNPVQARNTDALATLTADRLEQLQQMVVDLRKARDFAAAQSLVLTDRGRKTTEAVRTLLTEMNGEEQELLKARIEVEQADSRNAKFTIVFGTLAALVIAGMAGLLITRNIARPLKGLTDIAERITVGDLNFQVVLDQRSDEVGALTQAFERMSKSLRAMAAAAEQIAAGDLRSTLQPQSPNDVLGNAFVADGRESAPADGGIVEGTAVLGSAASEIVASTPSWRRARAKRPPRSAKRRPPSRRSGKPPRWPARRPELPTARRKRRKFAGGRKSTEDVARHGPDSRADGGGCGQAWSAKRQSQAIGKSSRRSTIWRSSRICWRSTRPSKQPKPGSRAKASRWWRRRSRAWPSNRNRRPRVRRILSDIQKATTAAVMATEQGSKAVEAGEKQIEAAGESIASAGRQHREAAQAATQIAASSQQQLVGMDQVAVAMENIKQASAQNVASAKQLETAARNLNELGPRLKQMVESYKV